MNKIKFSSIFVYEIDKLLKDVLTFIQDIKRNKKNELAITLQKEESRLFMSAYKELIKLKIDALTVHDSLYFKEIYKDQVKEVLDKVFMDNGYVNYKLE